MKSIGIIGGLGPETTAQFYLSVVFSCFQKNNIARPSIVVASVPLPYQIEEDLILRNQGTERYLPFLISEAQRLERAGADFIVMPCNSLHRFIAEIRGSVHVPVLSIVEEAARFLKHEGFKKIGIVSTSATKQAKLYDTALTEAGTSFETPNDIQQKKVDKIIHNLVMGERNDGAERELQEIIESFGAQTDCVLLACTDLQLLLKKSDRKVFDTMRILVDATVEKMA